MGKTDSSTLDITLDVVVIENECGIQPSGRNWRVQQISNPQNDADHCIIARSLRNRVKHGTLQSIGTIPQFTSYWTEIENALNGLHYNNMPFFSSIENRTNRTIHKSFYCSTGAKLADLEKKKVDINTTGITELTQKHGELEKKKVDVNTKEITELNQKHIKLEENKVDVNTANICTLKTSNASNEDELKELQSDMKSISLYLRGKYCYVLSEQYNFHENVFKQKKCTHDLQRQVCQFLCSLEVLFWFFFR